MTEVTKDKTIPAGQYLEMPAPMPSLGAILWIAWFSFREMARRRRLISLGLINLLPVMVVASIRIWFPDEGITAQQQLASLSHDTFITFLIPIVALAVGVSAIGEQVEDGTIVFMWTRPIRRRAIFLGRLLAAQTVSWLLLSLSLVLCFIVMVSEGPQIITWEFLRLYFQTFLIIGLGTFTYAALFATMGTFFKKPVLPAIIFAFGWENLVANIPARIQEWSLSFHLQNLVDRPPVDTTDLPGILGALLATVIQRDPVPKLQSIAVLLVVMVVATILGIWLLRQKEIEK
ncbi:MAG: ABC transporter permease [Gemmatimonadales bacterium]|nr:ABC transporter permease [Gemmatimonadales bacterium]